MIKNLRKMKNKLQEKQSKKFNYKKMKYKILKNKKMMKKI